MVPMFLKDPQLPNKPVATPRALVVPNSAGGLVANRQLVQLIRAANGRPLHGHGLGFRVRIYAVQGFEDGHRQRLYDARTIYCSSGC